MLALTPSRAGSPSTDTPVSTPVSEVMLCSNGVANTTWIPIQFLVYELMNYTQISCFLVKCCH